MKIIKPDISEDLNMIEDFLSLINLSRANDQDYIETKYIKDSLLRLYRKPNRWNCSIRYRIKRSYSYSRSGSRISEIIRIDYKVV